MSDFNVTTNRPTTRAAEEIIGLYFPVLDHGFVSLVDYMGGDADIERAARVSYGQGTRPKSKTEGLLRHLRRHKHTTPSEMVELKFHCAMPIFVARQWIRHRTASVNEYSGRYSLMPMTFYTPTQEDFQIQSKSNKQGRKGTVDEDVYDLATSRMEGARIYSSQTYQWMCEQDVARELARIDLPLSTYTQWYWKIDLHNLSHFLTLRVDSHAQTEIRRYGEIMAGMLKRVAPLSYQAWIDYDVSGCRFSWQEMDVLRRLHLWEKSEGTYPREHDDPICLHSALQGLGVSKREIDEFRAKLKDGQSRPDFDLDLSTAIAPNEATTRFFGEGHVEDNS